MFSTDHTDVEELPVRPAHRVRVHALVAPPDLERVLEEGGELGVREVAVRDQALALAEVLRDEEAAEDRAEVLDLLLVEVRGGK
jgi:hypothetical protein